MLLARTIIRHSLSTTRRTCFSTSAAVMAPTQEWMVILPDKPGMLAERMRIRPQHLEAAAKSAESGFVLMGGASLDEPFQDGQPPKINGSVMLAAGETREEVLAKLHEDIYAKQGVWDMDKVTIFPFKSAIRKGL